ncbi:hypothetical protein INS49_004332 [Diaporthe citri]|uniref:uncharacterized protein n=1 Tax=Diaporthe citri TaxID=83186 RepID=UPI001C7E3312|nr:uncharacterized protein INS49_004332 [Diaporthe citri]KAG6355250.1 hypothetical protein INS49_004332 [Diaporthe citri]
MAPEKNGMGPSGPGLLLATLAGACSSGEGYGSMSTSIYDTAWLAMIEKPVGSGQWLPESFDYILQQQSSNGDWPSYATVADGILNTAAALLALRRHLSWNCANEDLEIRCKKAQKALEVLLEQYDVSSCDQVGFEMLITQHINLLAADGVAVASPCLPQLNAVFREKQKRLSSSGDSIYQRPSTLLHSLESLIGHIDFDRIRCRLEPNGSMLNSPSSTAAYLMHASEWDDDAESYLRTVLRQGTGHGRGGLPCAWPTTMFEVSWTVTTLAHAGIPLEEEYSAALRAVLERALSEGQGRVGFTPDTSVPDADDTAKAILALRYLGKTDVDIGPLLATFEGDEHFLTYQGERNSSFSTNCNVLICLLMLEDPLPYTSQIIKTVQFLSGRIFTAQIMDKWHRSQLYSMMLLSQALEHLYSVYNTDLLREISSQCPILFNEHVPFASIQVLIKILTLSSLAHLPWLSDELDLYGIEPCVDRAKSYLQASGHSEWAKGKYIWIEKVTYASPLLSEVYCQAAMHVSLPQQRERETPTQYPSQVLPNPKVLTAMRKAGTLMAHTPLLGPSQLAPSLLRAAELQATYALRDLERHKHDVFPAPPRKNGADGNGRSNGDADKTAKDKYLIFVPLTWTACGALHGGRAASPKVLYDMMLFSMLVYQADEYMEGVVEQDLGTQLDQVRDLVMRVVRGEQARPILDRQRDDSQREDGVKRRELAADTEPSTALVDAELVLRKFISHVICHPSVVRSPLHLQTRLTGEVEAFLLAHLEQAEDNKTLRAVQREDGKMGCPRPDGLGHGSNHAWNGAASGTASGKRQNGRLRPSMTGRTFYNWVRSTSADHTSCPCAFVFFNCLVGSTTPRASPFDLYGHSAKTAYVAEDLCRHLASMCRMYNDHASVSRDHSEGNLNSIDFADFHHDGERGGLDTDLEASKTQLMWIAEYERQGMEAAMARLEGDVGGGNRLGREILDAVRLFISVTDLYGEIYVIRDITNRVKQGSIGAEE